MELEHSGSDSSLMAQRFWWPLLSHCGEKVVHLLCVVHTAVKVCEKIGKEFNIVFDV